MKRLYPIGGAVCAAVIGAVVLAASGTAQQPGGQTLKLVEREGTAHIVDNPPRSRRANGGPRFSMGDQTVQAIPLYDESNTRRLGTLHVECTAMRGGTPARATFHCNGTYQLGTGTLALDFAGLPADRVTFAVTGGTGALEGRAGRAGGQEKGALSEDLVHLVP